MVTLEKHIKSVKDVLTSEDIIVFEFESLKGKEVCRNLRRRNSR